MISAVHVLPLALAVLALAAWYFATLGQNGSSFVMAPPLAVVHQFMVTLGNGTLINNSLVTLSEVALGFAIGVSCAFALGYGISHSRLLDTALSPYAVGFQAVPIVAIAPVLIRFFGPGLISNGIICALIVFFPMLVSTIVAMRNVDPDLRDMMHSLKATRWQMFTRLEIPAALPVLFGGLKVSATLAVAAAVVGEAVSSEAGLGFMIYSARYVYDTSSVLVGVFTLTGLAVALYAFVSRLEGHFLSWQRRGH